jgi:RHS repeat-associated protein
MKFTRLLILGLFAMTAVCQGQITDPGWYQADVPDMSGGEIDTSTNLTYNAASVQASGISSAAGVPSAPVAEVITPQIQALADGLQDDPQQIFNYVHNHIKYVLYFGSKKGAQLTLLERSGNDFDQCALLMALLRAAGYTSAQYQFGWQWLPYADPNNQGYDLIHWWKLGLPNTNTVVTRTFVLDLLALRGYPQVYYSTDGNSFLFQRVWVNLTIGSTTYNFDPGFKVYEPNFPEIILSTAIGGSTTVSNGLLSAASGLNTGNYVTNLNEVNVRNTLTSYTTNLLNYIHTNVPNESVEDILGESVDNIDNFYYGTWDSYDPGNMPVVSWTYEPTNLMSTLAITFAGTNHQWYMPQLQGQRLALTFDASGTAQLWQDDTLLAQHTTSGTSDITNVVLTATHPVGHWNTTNNTFIPNPTNFFNVVVTNSYQRTNANYALLYAFEPDQTWLQQRQHILDGYIAQGLANNSRQVLTETLNIMGLNWMIQTAKMEDMLAAQLGMLPQYYHRLGRMGQETGKGYYVDAYMQLTAGYPNSGDDAAHVRISNTHFDLFSFFSSAFENGIIEQLQNSNMVGASTVKMLQIANTNGQAVFLASSTNWTTHFNVKGQLVNYDTTTLNNIQNNFINKGFYVLLPQNGSNHVTSASGSWAGYGYEARKFTNGMTAVSAMQIAGGYNGGFSGGTGSPDPIYVVVSSDGQTTYYIPTPANTPAPAAADPVDIADATFQLETPDLSLGQAEPRGITLSRYYNGTRRNSNPAGMAPGWIHNYCVTANTIPAPQAGLGGTTPAQAAPMLAATAAAIAMYNGAVPDAKNWLTTALIAKWGVDQLTKNSVAIAFGKDTVQFIQQPDGSFTPPAGSTMTLTRNGSGYALQQRHDNTYNFNSNGLLTSIVDQYNNSLALTYTNSLVSTVTDWKNRTFTFNYTGTPLQLTSVSDGTRTVHYGYSTAYNPQGDLTSFTDPESKTSAYQYDTNHQITAVLDAQSRLVLSNLYNSQGHLTTQYTQGDTNKTWNIFWSDFKTATFDPKKGEIDYLYDDHGRLKYTLEEILGETDFFYDGQNHTIITQTPELEVNLFVYDGNNNLTQTADPLTFTNNFIYDDQNRLIRIVDKLGNSSTFGYDSHFSLTGKTNAMGDFVNYTYNTDGTRATRTDSGGMTSYGYDSYGQLNSIAYPNSLGNESFVNSSLGDATSRTDGRGFQTTFQYNQRRQLTNTIAPTNLTSQIAYDAIGNVAGVTDGRGNTTSNTWSATAHLLATTFPATAQGVAVVSNIYDSHDLLIKTLDPYQQPTFYTNDAKGRVVYQTDPLLRTSAIGYDKDSRITATTNAAQEVTSQVWDPRGFLRIVTDPALRTYRRLIDGGGNQTALTNRNGWFWLFQYDAANRLTNTTSPQNHTISQSWNHQGLLSSVKDMAGQTTSYYYDGKGRLTNRTDNVASTLYGLDANDNVTSVVEGGKTNSWTFDAYNRVANYTDTSGNLIQYRYDANDNLTNLVYPGNKTVAYTYDSLNRLLTVTDWANRQTTFTYDLMGRLTTVSRPNGTVRTINYDAVGQATNIVEKSSWNYPIAFFAFNFDSAGRTKWDFLAPLPHTNSPPSRTMTYNTDDRLITVNGTQVFSDGNGNMTNAPLPSGVFTNYQYDARNRLLNAGGVTNVYDALDDRIGQTSATGSTTYVVNPNTKLSQVLMRIKNGITNYYIYGGGLLYQITESAGGTNTLTYHFDSRGSTIALTGDNGIPTDQIEYSAYGSTTYRAGTNDTPFLFNGQYGVMTDANGLLYMRARYYNPYLCRFLNADPSGFAAGLNFYAYANGNPVNLIDPFGLDVVKDWQSVTDPNMPWWKKALSAIAYSSEEDDYRYSLQQRNPQLYQQMYPPVNTGEASYATLLMLGATVLQPELAERTIPELIANPVPGTLARVIPNGIKVTTLGAPGAVDVFVADASQLEGLNAQQIAEKLAIPQSPTGFQVIKFATPQEGLASPVFRSNPGFIGGGQTAGGASEFVIPNGPIPSGATTTVVH